MLKFTRNKLVSIDRRDHNTLAVHGILDDDIYSVEIDATISISNLEILSIEGKWNRWTTPECQRATQFIEEAVGFRVGPELKQKVHKIIGRKSCRHFANLILECCHSAKEAAMIAKWEDAKLKQPELSFEEFILEGPVVPSVETTPPDIEMKTSGDQEIKTVAKPVTRINSGGSVIDLHVHTFPASPCSSAAVNDIVVEAGKIGLDGICLTDHNYVWSYSQIEDLRQRYGFLILAGNEITTDQGDVLVFGLTRNIKGIISIKDLKAEASENGAFLIVAHPIRGFLTFGANQVGLTPEKVMERDLFKQVDAVETLNGKVTIDENDFAFKVAAGLGLPATGGSDAHEVNEVGKYATHFTAHINNEQDLIGALKTGDYAPVAFRSKIGLKENQK